VVKTKSIHRDTLVKTRIKKRLALAMPCLVTLKEKVNILKLTIGSPGVNILKSAGRAIKRENNGIKTHVRFKKKPRWIEERPASTRQNIYIPIRKWTFLENRTAKRKNRRLGNLIRGSPACKNPIFDAFLRRISILLEMKRHPRESVQ
jgi:hypothetical protein